MAGTSIPELAGGGQWSSTITYSFLTDWPSYYSDADKAARGPLQQLSPDQQAAINQILQYIHSITGIVFKLVPQDNANNQIEDITSVLPLESGLTHTSAGGPGLSGNVALPFLQRG